LHWPIVRSARASRWRLLGGLLGPLLLDFAFVPLAILAVIRPHHLPQREGKSER
jgi:hypothetical protein